MSRIATLKHRQRHQRGFALLLVFLMASAVALMLYAQMPRQAFESERDKEQMLIDRGEQYKRAIYVYYISNNRQYPSKIDDLESTNGHRYLRHRYIDPYTGKDEWRLVHTNGAFLTDSLVTPPPQGAPGQATPGQGAPGQGGSGVTGGALAGTGPPTGSGSLIASATSTGGADPNAPPAVNAQVQRRASDQTMVQNSSYSNIAGGSGGAVTPNNDPGYQPFNPASLPPISLYPNGYNSPATNMPGANPTGVNPNGNPNGGNPAGANPGGLQATLNQSLNQLTNPTQNPFNQPGLNQNGLNQNGLNQNGLNQNGVNPNGVNQPGVNPNNGVSPLGAFGLGGANPVNNGFTGTPPANIPGTNFPLTNPGLSAPNPSNITSSSFGQSGGQLQNPVNTNPFSTQQFPSGNVGAPPGAGGAGVPGTPGVPGANSQAANLINQLLTQPRQPPAGIGPNQNPTTGGGLAGVASTYKGATIKSYADRTKYQEWEFVFQPNVLGGGTQLQPPQGANGAGGVPGGAPATGAGMPGSVTPGFGSAAPGFGPAAPGFGAAPGAAGTPGTATLPGSSAPGIGGTAPGQSSFGPAGFGPSTNP